MSVIQWFSVALILTSLGIFIFSLQKAKKMIQPTANNLNNLKNSIQLEIHHYTNEVNFQSQKIEQIKQKITLLKQQLQSDTMTFENFRNQQTELTTAIEDLKVNLPKIAAKTSQSFLYAFKDKSVQTWNVLKLTFKKTFEKQKARLLK